MGKHVTGFTYFIYTHEHTHSSYTSTCARPDAGVMISLVKTHVLIGICIIPFVTCEEKNNSNDYSKLRF